MCFLFLSLSALFYSKSAHLHQNFPLKITLLYFFPLMSSIVWMLFHHWMFCSISFTLPAFLQPVLLFPISIYYDGTSYEVGFRVKRKWGSRDISFYCFFTLLFQFLLKKVMSEKSQELINLLKMRFVCQLAPSFVICEDGNASLNDLSEVFQQCSSTEGSLILLLFWNPQVRSLKCLP